MDSWLLATMSLSLNDECYYLGICLAGFLFGTISVCFTIATPLAKACLPPSSGLYSGIFALYLQCYASRTDTAKANYILFYSLCFLYMLSVATIGFDIVSFVVISPVSKIEPLFFFQKKSRTMR